MTNRETATIKVPLDVWGRMASVADHRGVKGADLLVEAIGLVIGRVSSTARNAPSGRRPEVRPRHVVTDGDRSLIRTMTLNGATALEIGRAIGMSEAGVTGQRKQLGLVRVGREWIVREES